MYLHSLFCTCEPLNREIFVLWNICISYQMWRPFQALVRSPFTKFGLRPGGEIKTKFQHLITGHHRHWKAALNTRTKTSDRTSGERIRQRAVLCRNSNNEMAPTPKLANSIRYAPKLGGGELIKRNKLFGNCVQHSVSRTTERFLILKQHFSSVDQFFISHLSMDWNCPRNCDVIIKTSVMCEYVKDFINPWNIRRKLF